MTLGRCPLSIFCSRGAPPRNPESIILSLGDRGEGFRFSLLRFRVDEGVECFLLSLSLVFCLIAFDDRVRIGVPREQKMLKGHLSRVIYHQVY